MPRTEAAVPPRATMTACDQEEHCMCFLETDDSHQKQKDPLFRFNIPVACAWGAAAVPAAGDGAERAAEHRSLGETRETRDLSQTDICSHDGMEETGRGYGDVSVYYHLGVKSPRRGQPSALPARAGQCLGFPTFCSLLALLL